MSVHKDEKNKTKDGRCWYFKASYEDLYGKRHIYKSKKYKTMKEAKEEESIFLYSQNSNNKAHITFKALFNSYFNNYDGVKGSTLYTKESRLRIYALPYFENMDINKIESIHIKKWKLQINENDLSINYKKALFNSLSSLFRYAINEFNLKENPCHNVENFKDKVDKIKDDEIIYMTFEQFKIFDSVIDDLEDKALFNFLYYMGVRKGEALSLKWNDIDFNSKRIKIIKTFSSKNWEKGKKVGSKETNTKNKKNRYIGMPEQLKNIMYKLYRQNQEYRDFSNNWYIFGKTSHLGMATIDRHKDYYFQKAQEIDSTIPRLTIHQFRHSHASLLISNKIPVQLIAERLGDSIEVVLKTYAHLFPETEKEVINLLENI